MIVVTNLVMVKVAGGVSMLTDVTGLPRLQCSEGDEKSKG